MTTSQQRDVLNESDLSCGTSRSIESVEGRASVVAFSLPVRDQDDPPPPNQLHANRAFNIPDVQRRAHDPSRSSEDGDGLRGW
ncbi:unnamed protein product [Amoebophrya sp. A120]|nr:unnamed protein product [Amoebophrya sp. A120]|eukprot:GSA120T00019420001.1